MQAVQITAYGRPLQCGPAPEPQLGPGEVLVRVRASGLCSTDVHLLSGRVDLGQLPRIPGHEIAGEVAALGPETRGWQLGSRVIVALDVTCGLCRHCLTGQTQRCPNKQRIGFERDGGHADYVSVPAANLVALPNNVSYEAGAVLPDAVACMYHCLISQGQVGINQRVVILGVGGLGIHGVQIARLAGAAVLATSRRAHRLAAAQEHGAATVNTAEEDLSAAVARFTDGEGADVVADCIGTQASIREGISLLRPGGKLLVIAYLDQEFVVPSMALFAPEREIIGCRGSNRQELADVVDLVAAGKLTAIVTASYPLGRIGDAVEVLERGDVVGRIVMTRDA